MDYFVGLDVSLRSVAVCVIDTKGNALLERSVACEIEDITQCLAFQHTLRKRSTHHLVDQSQMHPVLAPSGLPSSGGHDICRRIDSGTERRYRLCQSCTAFGPGQ